MPISTAAAAAWGSDAATTYAATMTVQNTWQSTLASVIGVYGYIRQAAALDRQVDLQERMTDHAERYIDLAERSFEEITLDAYTCQKKLFTRYDDTLDQCVDEFLGETKRLKEYDGQYKVQEGRAVGSVRRAIDRARVNRANSRDRYGVGRCCHEGIWFDMEQARLESTAANAAYDAERARKIQLDEWYFQRQSIGAQLVENYRAQVISGVNSGVTNVANGLNAIGGAVGSAIRAAGQQGDAIRDQASLFGTLANGAFRFAGYSAGFAQGGNAPQSSWFGTGGALDVFNSVAGPGGINAGGSSGLLGTNGGATQFSPGGAVPSGYGNGVGMFGAVNLNGNS